MNAKVEHEQGASPADKLKYTIAALIVLAGIVGFYWFADWPGAVRGAALFGTLVLAGVVFALTERGRAFGEFLSESRFELRKVVWPTRQETLRSTGLILVVVVIISIMLMIIDFFLSSGVRALLGTGG
jgi:preprotein translocase subunit SecE